MGAMDRPLPDDEVAALEARLAREVELSEAQAARGIEAIRARMADTPPPIVTGTAVEGWGSAGNGGTGWGSRSPPGIGGTGGNGSTPPGGGGFTIMAGGMGMGGSDQWSAEAAKRRVEWREEQAKRRTELLEKARMAEREEQANLERVDFIRDGAILTYALSLTLQAIPLGGEAVWAAFRRLWDCKPEDC